MNNDRKIEFYKRRSVGEVLSAGADFIRQNGKVLFKNILIIGVPLACLHGYFMHRVEMQGGLELLFINGDLGESLSTLGLHALVAIVLSLFLYSMTIAIINQYGEGKLSAQTGWNDLKDDVFSYAKKIFFVGLVMIGMIVVFAFAVGLLFGGLDTLSPSAALIFSFIIIVLLIAFAPGLCLIVYPAVFHQQSAGSSIATALSLGFRYWGSTFLVVLISCILTLVFTYLLASLYTIWAAFGTTILPMGIVFDIVCYILAMISSCASLIASPIIVTFFSFQYFNVVEREDGVSVQSEMDEFDNL